MYHFYFNRQLDKRSSTFCYELVVYNVQLYILCNEYNDSLFYFSLAQMFCYISCKFQSSCPYFYTPFYRVFFTSFFLFLLIIFLRSFIMINAVASAQLRFATPTIRRQLSPRWTIPASLTTFGRSVQCRPTSLPFHKKN